MKEAKNQPKKNIKLFSFTPDDPIYGWNRLLGYRFLIFSVLIL